MSAKQGRQPDQHAAQTIYAGDGTYPTVEPTEGARVLSADWDTDQGMNDRRQVEHEPED